MKRSFALALTIWIVAAGEARAATITWEFEAIVRATSGLSGSTLPYDVYVYQPGQILRGSLSFESTVSDVEPAASRGVYPGLLTSLYLEYAVDWIGEGTPPYFAGSASSFTTSEMSVVNLADFPIDRMFLTSGFEPEFLGASSIRTFRLELYQLEDGPSLWSSAAMVLTPPALSELLPFDFSTLPVNGLTLSSQSGDFRVGAELTLLRAVSEPARFVLVWMGFLALIGFRLRSHPT